MAEDKYVKGSTAIKDITYYLQEQSATEKCVDSFLGMLETAKKQVQKETEQKVYENADDVIKERIRRLEGDCSRMKIKLQNAMPMNMLILFAILLAALVATVTIFVIQIIANVKIVDYYKLIFLMVMNLGLFCTSTYTIICWKRFLKGE